MFILISINLQFVILNRYLWFWFYWFAYLTTAVFLASLLFFYFVGWLTVCMGDNTKAWCKACKCTLNAHKKDLIEHGKTKKHDQSIKRSVIVGHSSKITNFFNNPIEEPRKIAELKIAAFVAEHYSIKSVDHLGVLIKELDPASSVLKELKIHRSKCTALIRNVIAPCFLEELLEEIGDSHFSIIIDESTAVDTKKFYV